MSVQNEQKVTAEGFYPEEDYVAMRKASTQPPAYTIDHDSPISEPAWFKHPTTQPKAARFEKLTRWDKRANVMQKALVWGIVAAGAATVAGPAILTHLPH